MHVVRGYSLTPDEVEGATSVSSGEQNIMMLAKTNKHTLKFASVGLSRSSCVPEVNRMGRNPREAPQTVHPRIE